MTQPVGLTPQQQNLSPREGMESWVMQLDSVVCLETTGYNRYGQPTSKEMKIGPLRRGFEFQISTADREDNQRNVMDPRQDPFRNGTFVRTDRSQDTDPNTASKDALTTEALIDICDLQQPAFEARVQELGEVPLRRLAEMAESMDIGYQKVRYVQDYVADRFASGGPQKSLDGEGEKLS